MTNIGNFKAKKTSSEEVVLEIGAEGGSLEIRRFRAPDGSWKFVFLTDESTMVDFLDSADPLDFVRRYPQVDSFEEALQLMNRYPWHEMRIVRAHQEYADITQSARQKGSTGRRNKPMTQHGKLTAAVATSITPDMNKRGFDVYYDHDEAGEFVGAIAVALGKELRRESQLSQLDIAVVERHTKRAIALIEVEESPDTPKTLIGDIFAVLMGSSVHLPGRKTTVEVGRWTTLIILARGAAHDRRIEQIEGLTNRVKSAFGTGNSEIGTIVIGAFANDKELETNLRTRLDDAIDRSKRG
jgi:hypothetical protein